MSEIKLASKTGYKNLFKSFETKTKGKVMLKSGRSPFLQNAGKAFASVAFLNLSKDNTKVYLTAINGSYIQLPFSEDAASLYQELQDNYFEDELEDEAHIKCTLVMRQVIPSITDEELEQFIADSKNPESNVRRSPIIEQTLAARNAGEEPPVSFMCTAIEG